jgi:hypothetical protein
MSGPEFSTGGAAGATSVCHRLAALLDLDVADIEP